ncbi:hypothetical protein DFP72DRAFT_205413 [Ephemerocybe angulata]|uniref:Uncharacterized protein n=1 Tax=Ephemerocybe angulata TaxID=980116 RepID=A0A8H6MEG4_9AGAR|nr:hypothetical protein DFP72DRAFT_205413 [Tulosesus angulatus]
MKFNLASIFGTVLAAGAAFNIAYAHSDHENVNFARSFVDELSTRSSSVEVPFQHSLREFLEGAVSAHRRALDSDYGADLEARDTCTVVVQEIPGLRARPPHFSLEVNRNTKASKILEMANTFHKKKAQSLKPANGRGGNVRLYQSLAELFPPNVKYIHMALA